MSEKILKGRLVQKHDTAENWSKATSFVPKQGEVIVYDVDENYNYERIKIGDGSTLVSNLPFADDALRTALLAEIESVDNKVDAVSTLIGDSSVSTQISNATANYYTKTQIDAYEFITVADIDEICGNIPEGVLPQGDIDELMAQLQ